MEFLTTGASTKQLHAGSAVMNGILAARLAAAGATGPETVLEGPHGLYATLTAREPDYESVTSGLGSRWETTQITIKPYPSCQLMHATLEAVRDAQPKFGARTVADIVEVAAQVHPDSASFVCEPADLKVAPRTSYDAKFSLPWSVAALLTDGQVGVGTYDLSSVHRPEVVELSQRVRTILRPTDGVAADAAGDVVITFTDGSTVTGHVDCSSGGPKAPLSDAALLEKFLGNAGEAATDLARDLLALGTDATVTARTLAAAASQPQIRSAS